jgi:S-formylglutathione hydrolase FrmB
MGSMGAAKYAVNHPNLFAGCSCMSGAPLNIRKVYNDTDNSFNNRFKKDVELAGGLEAYLNSYENVWDKCQDIAKMENPPKFYFCIGKEDGLYPSYMEFKKYAQEIGFKAAWEELDGYAHEWRFWELEIQRTLQFFGFTKTHTTPSNVNFKPVEKEEKEQTEKIDDPDKKIDAWSL